MLTSNAEQASGLLSKPDCTQMIAEYETLVEGSEGVIRSVIGKAAVTCARIREQIYKVVRQARAWRFSCRVQRIDGDRRGEMRSGWWRPRGLDGLNFLSRTALIIGVKKNSGFGGANARY